MTVARRVPNRPIRMAWKGALSPAVPLPTMPGAPVKSSRLRETVKQIGVKFSEQSNGLNKVN